MGRSFFLQMSDFLIINRPPFEGVSGLRFLKEKMPPLEGVFGFIFLKEEKTQTF